MTASTQSALGLRARANPARVDRQLIIIALLPALICGCASSWKMPQFGWLKRDAVDVAELDDDDRFAATREQRQKLADRGVNPDDVSKVRGRSGLFKRRSVLSSRRSAEADRKQRELLKAAHSKYEQGEYDKAAKLFDDIVDARKPKRGIFDFLTGGTSEDTYSRFRTSDSRPIYDPVREEAAFYLAECYRLQNRLPKASTYYRLIVKSYPSSRYLSQCTNQLFDISRQWLQSEDFATSDEIQQVNLENPDSNHSLSSVSNSKRRWGWLPNFCDRSRPVVGTTSAALNNLKTIWLNDPTGPVADDALMLAATYNLRARNYQEADRLMKILREEFPRSKHLQTAFVLGSHVKLMSYQGAKYDAAALEDARTLKESTLRLFPDLPESDRIRRELKGIQEARAKREWERVVYWGRKKKDRAVLLHCQELVKNFPQTSYADQARAKIKELGGTPVDAGRSSVEDDSVQPFESQPVEGDGPVFVPAAPPVIENPKATGNAPGRVRL